MIVRSGIRHRAAPIGIAILRVGILRLLFHVLVAGSVFVVLLPFLWILLSSVKPYADILAVPPRFFPSHLTLDNYVQALTTGNIPRYFLNSSVYSGGGAAIDILLGAPAAFALSKFSFAGRRFLLVFVLATQFFPAATLLISLYRFWSSVHLFNSYASLILTYAAFTMPVCIWLLRGFFAAVPSEIEDAAAMDGCSPLGVLFRITIPIARSGIIACAVYVFISVWQDFILALTLTSSDDMHPLPVGLYSFIGQFVTQWNLLLAASVIVAIPVLVLFLALQRYFIQGIAAGAVK